MNNEVSYNDRKSSKREWSRAEDTKIDFYVLSTYFFNAYFSFNYRSY